MRLAHVTAATDLVPSSDEIQAIDAYRTRLLQAMDAAGVARPGQPEHELADSHAGTRPTRSTASCGRQLPRDRRRSCRADPSAGALDPSKT